MRQTADGDGHATQTIRALIVDERSYARDQAARRLKKRDSAEIEALPPGMCLNIVRQREFDVIFLGRIAHRHLQKQLVVCARQRNPKVVIAAVDPEGLVARVMEYLDNFPAARAAPFQDVS